MKKIYAVSLNALLCAGLISCTGLVPAAPRADRINQQRDKTLTAIDRPDLRASEETKANDLPLPKPGLSRAEAVLRLREHALRFQSGLQAWLRAAMSAGKKTNPIDAKKNSRASVEKSQAKPPVNRKRPPAVDLKTNPPVRPVSSDDSTASSRGTADPKGTRTIYARLGDDVEFSFNEKGWLLLEKPSEGSGLKYVSRHIEEGRTLFKFRGQKIGDYLLPFQYQDQVKGTIARQTVNIKVVSQKEFDAAMGGRESEADKADKAKRRAAAARLLELGDSKDALREYLSSYSEGDPDLNQLIAALALREKDYPNAILFWKKNLDAEAKLRDQAVLGLVRAYLAVNDRNALAGLVRPLLAVRVRPIEEELGLLIGYFSALRMDALGYDLLCEYLKRFPTGGRIDHVLFLLGQLYEFCTPLLDFKKSRECYAEVVTNFPESRYFAPSRERVQFLDRHYFRVE
ncbi:MAG: hypothetical protein JXD23_15450 [Spirochaetales bacterium]|nr:hypothetical protein [Spirochaetales bacterium]